MTKRKGQPTSVTTREPLIGLSKDIEANGIGYVKSKVTLDRLLAINPDLLYTYDPEDRSYTVYTKSIKKG